MDKRIKATLAITAAAFALCIGAALLGDHEEPAPVHTPTITPVQDQTTEAQETAATEEPDASDLWSDDGSLHRIKPLDVALDAETQWAIYRNCGYDPGLFSLVMAIAEHESEFQPDLQGDNGQSIGIMQINTRWHTGRMEALGVTDLTDPVQCAAVAIDYLQELESRYGFEAESEAILMAYNCGPSKAKRLIEAGTTSITYSQEVITIFRGYRAEMETAPGDCSTEGGKAEQSPTYNTNSINAGKEEVKP